MGWDVAWTVPEAVIRLKRLRLRRLYDHTLEWIDLTHKHHTDAELVEMIDHMLACPNVITHVWLCGNRLTDETGVRLARFVAASTTIEYLDLRDNQFGEETYLAIAAALHANSSLRILYLYGNQAVNPTRVEAAFVEALRLNTDRPFRCEWWLYSMDNDFDRLQRAADALGPPSMLSQLRHYDRT